MQRYTHERLPRLMMRQPIKADNHQFCDNK